MYPEFDLYNYIKDKISHFKNPTHKSGTEFTDIYLVNEMSHWKDLIKKDFPVNIHQIVWNKLEEIPLNGSLVIALINLKEKYSYMKRLYNLKIPFIVFSATSTLGLTKCGELFRKCGINIDIIQQIIYFIDELGIRRKPPFTTSIFTSNHFGNYALNIIDKKISV